jgi:hypothetical protein
VQLELDLSHIVRHVLVVEGLHVDGPLVRVPVALTLLAKMPALGRDSPIVKHYS